MNAILFYDAHNEYALLIHQSEAKVKYFHRALLFYALNKCTFNITNVMGVKKYILSSKSHTSKWDILEFAVIIMMLNDKMYVAFGIAAINFESITL